MLCLGSSSLFKSVIFGLQEPESEDQRVLLNLEPLKELLRSPALRVVTCSESRHIRWLLFHQLCHAIANALEEASSIVEIIFDPGCTFPAGGRAIIANALKTNASVTNVEFLDDFGEHFCNTLAAVLLCNSTLLDLTLQLPEGRRALVEDGYAQSSSTYRVR